MAKPVEGLAVEVATVEGIRRGIITQAAPYVIVLLNNGMEIGESEPVAWVPLRFGWEAVSAGLSLSFRIEGCHVLVGHGFIIVKRGERQIYMTPQGHVTGSGARVVYDTKRSLLERKAIVRGVLSGRS